MCQYADRDNAVEIENCDVVHREEGQWRWIPVALKCIVNGSLLFEENIMF